MAEQKFYQDLVNLLNETKNVLPKMEGQIGYQKYSYADLGSILDAVKPILKKYGFAISQFVKTSFKEDGLDMVIIKTVLFHTSGEKIEQELAVPIGEDGRGTYIQKIGSTITYARRYSLSGILGIATDIDDDGVNAGENKPQKKNQKKEPTKEDLQKIIIAKTGIPEDKIIEYLIANGKIQPTVISLKELDISYLSILANNTDKLKQQVENFKNKEEENA